MRTFKQKVIVDDTTKEIYDLYYECLLIKKISEMRKILSSNGAWSENNNTELMVKMERNNVPQWERDIITRNREATKKQSYKLLKKLDELTTKLNK